MEGYGKKWFNKHGSAMNYNDPYYIIPKNYQKVEK